MTENSPQKEQKTSEVLARLMNELTPEQAFGICALRYDVFVREQQSIFNDHDGEDRKATHIFIEDQGEVIAYARVFQTSADAATIGRVAVAEPYRGKGLGRQIVQKAIAEIKQMHDVSNIHIEAQEYLKEWYEGFGFEVVTDPFEDEKVWHVGMALTFQDK